MEIIILGVAPVQILILDGPEDKMSNDFSENTNVLFDEDADEDQLVLCYNVFEKGFHIVLNPFV